MASSTMQQQQQQQQEWTKFGSGFSTSDTVSIAARTKKLPVNHHVPLDYYLATADSLLKQGQVYRDQGSVLDCYVLLLRFASLVCETLPDHRNYRLYETQINKYRQKLEDVTSELKKLKPQVEEQVRHDHNKAADIKAKHHPRRELSLRKGKECSICAERRPSTSFISTKDCVHEYCTECCRHHAEVRVMSGSARVDCPHPDCAHAFHISQCATLLSAANFDILSTRLTEAAIPAAHKVFCPFQDCSFLMERSEDEGGRGPFAVCFACHRGFCLECKVPWHGSFRSCAEYRAHAANAKHRGDQKLRDLAKENKWQVCPDCAVVVELKSGCYHITCRCGTEFCYLCQKKWVKKKPTCKCKFWDERNIIDHRQRLF